MGYEKYIGETITVRDSYGIRRTGRIYRNGVNPNLFYFHPYYDSGTQILSLKYPDCFVDSPNAEFKFEALCDKVIKKNSCLDRSVYKQLLSVIEKNSNGLFEGFVHMTELSNFQNMIRTGFLFSRSYLKESGQSFVDRAWHGALEKTPNHVLDCVRFYYHRFTPCFYQFKTEEKVCMVFDKALIMNPNSIVLTKSAAGRDHGMPVSMSDAIDFVEWEKVFSVGPILDGELKNSVIKHRNTDFLVNGKVSVNLIKKIYCDSHDVEVSVKKILSDNKMKQIEVDYQPGAFIWND